LLHVGWKKYWKRCNTVRKNTIQFEDWETEKLKDPEFQAAAEELELWYQIARLRILQGLTQAQLAEMVGTGQPSIARLENERFSIRPAKRASMNV
jgi:predicted XRE-type DNA-binding protein